MTGRAIAKAHAAAFTRLAATALTAAVVWAGGCATDQMPRYAPTEAGRRASFESYNELAIADASAADVVDRHTALLMGNRTFYVQAAGPRRWRLMSRPIQEDQPSGAGLAVPLTTDGYFLTAGHNVTLGGPALYLLPPEIERLLAHPHGVNERTPYLATFLAEIVEAMRVEARVVWHSEWEPSDPEDPRRMSADRLDLAIVHAPVTVDQPVEWADVTEVQHGTELLAGTPPWSSPIGGRFLGISHPLPSDPEIPARYFAHTAPTRPGDSGGPVLLTDGRLIGIVVGGTEEARRDFLLFSLHYARTGVALAPDPESLMKIVEHDRSNP